MLAGAIAFKDPLPPQDGLAFTALASRPEAGSHRDGRRSHRRAGALARAAARRAPRRDADAGLSRRPGPHRLCGRPRRAGERDRGCSTISPPPATPCAARRKRRANCSMRWRAAPTTRRCRSTQYEDLLTRLPTRQWRACARPGASRPTIPMCATARSVSAPKISATSWSRCRPIAAAPRERRADYHDPPLPPRHALVAFGLWLQHVAKVDALVHMGAHGTLEWLPGKAVALTAECFPEIVTGRAAGDLSVHRQQSGRSGAGQAPHCRRDHRPSAAAAGRRRAERRRARA